jgi:FdhD protein
MNDPRVSRRRITRFADGAFSDVEDAVAAEGPLEIRIGGRTLAVTLRTPGHDRELALGFLASETLIAARSDVAALEEVPATCSDQPDAIDVTLAPGRTLDWTRLERHFTATSACGLCGRAHLDSLRAGLTPIPVTSPLDPAALGAIPARLRRAQETFEATGGLHASAWLDEALETGVLREDVGRHNAVDKVAGWLIESGRYPAGRGVLWASGRAGAEIVLKCARARIPVLAAVGAPTSLAIELAESAHLTLIGFLREDRMNVYSGRERLAVRA